VSVVPLAKQVGGANQADSAQLPGSSGYIKKRPFVQLSLSPPAPYFVNYVMLPHSTPHSLHFTLQPLTYTTDY